MDGTIYKKPMGNKQIFGIFVIVLLLCLIAGQTYADNDYPHNETTGTSCTNCHNVLEETNMVDVTSHSTGIDDTMYNNVCWGCHNSGVAKVVTTHSSLQIDNGYGDWSVECTTCHNPHANMQVRAYTSDTFYRATGTSDISNGIQLNYPLAGQSTLTDSDKTWEIDEFKDLMLIPNTFNDLENEIDYRQYGYKIIGNTENTITVQDIYSSVIASGDTYVVVYGKIVKETIDTGDILNNTPVLWPKDSGGKTVKFFNNTGPNSFADTDATDYDGICEVCHTETYWHKNTSAGDHSHNNEKNCTTQCHKHTEGFKGSGCDACHGFPPTSDLPNSDSPGENTGLVENPGPTYSQHAGVHDTHVTTKGYDCTFCHFNSDGQGAGHNNGDPQDITIGFSLFGGSSGGGYDGGIYDGQWYSDGGGGSTVNYDSSEGNTTVVTPSTGTMTCSSIYCHGKIQGDALPWGGGQATVPVWNAPGSMTCTSCHDEGGLSTLLGYKHGKHTDAATYGFACEKCHYDTATGSTAIKNEAPHADNEKTVVDFAGGAFDSGTKTCSGTYCHSDASNDPPTPGGPPNIDPVEWESSMTMDCNSCHNGLTGDTPQMISNGHYRLTSDNGDRQYPCYTCHDDTMDPSNVLDGYSSHVNEVKDIVFRPKWYLFSGATPTYDPVAKVCDNFYCHSDGATVNPKIEPYPWTDPPQGCNACHGHRGNCADCHTDITGWAEGEEWKSAMPMYTNEGPGLPKANSHIRHVQTKFTCDQCHPDTVLGGACSECHDDTIPPGPMDESGHVDTIYHLNKEKDVTFTGTYDDRPNYKTCTGTGTACHTGAIPQWGDKVTGLVICLECHGETYDQDDFQPFNDVRGKINMDEFKTTGHGRLAADGAYPESGNPAADFPGNPCWYCHDNQVIHNDYTNPFRLKQHDQFDKRFAKECVYCHMEGLDSECLTCHNTTESTLAPQLIDLTADSNDNTRADGTSSASRPDHAGETVCLTNNCHGDGSVPIDGWTHYSKAGFWEDYEVNSVKSQYMMMGVCLKCHDDDSNNKCTECHDAVPNEVINGGTKYISILRNYSTADDEPGVGVNWTNYWSADGTTTDPDDWKESEAYTDNKFELGYDPGTGFVVAAQARASSVHFGYKHYAVYETSFGVSSYDGTVVENATKVNKFINNESVWTVDQWAGDYVMMKAGSTNEGEYRRILNNTADTIIMAEDFTNPVQQDDTYYINDPVWKGGKFCWDCHDPHGDTNIYMIQDEVATETDGTFGTPVTKRTVSFTKASSGTDYVKTTGSTPDDYDGICNVCHTEAGMHYKYNYGNAAHNLGRKCTNCHEHRFTDSHASGLSCKGCHGAKPVPRHSGFGLPKDCTKCHAGIINKRVDIVTQLSATNSHHIQGVEVTNRHCYACHWEATDIGLINEDYHEGYSFSDHISEKNAAADLVIWGAGTRPTTYETDVTATSFIAVNIGTANERTEVENVTKMCLSCHSAQNNDYQPFNIVDPLQGDCKTPNQYAWDGTSIAERYSQTGTTTWGKYETVPNAAPKNLQKAFSAHGNAVNNEGGWNPGTGPGTGLDGAITSTRGGSRNVQCFDCHSSHGSRTTGITSSYATFNGTFNGANLKETQAGKGGYFRTYRARANTASDAINPFNEGAAQCFDCHHTENARTELFEQPGNYSPWGYTETFGVDEGIGVMGYKDTPYFAEGVTASIARYPYRDPKASRVGGHLHASKPIKDSGTSTGGSTITVDDSTKSAVWTTDKWAGYFVLMKSGANDGEMRKIVSNTTIQLTVYAFDNDVGTDDYEIVQPMIKERGTASGGDTITVVDGSKVGPKAWTTDQWVGNFVLMKSGNNAGKLRRISENTETELTVDEFANDIAIGDSYEIVPYAKTINGLCTPCHDPHGVSPTLGENQRYGVPLLKGTWMTSPYKEDHPPNDPTGGCARDDTGLGFNTAWGDARACTPGSAFYSSTSYYIDRNTFSSDSNADNFARISEDDQEFAGLCLKCHPKENLTDGTPKNTKFRTKDRIHESVKGWGENSEHSWPCAKCHQPHISGLPRLMQTNCLDYEHRGPRESGGVWWTSKRQEPSNAPAHGHYRGYPMGNVNGNSASYKAEESCHTRASYNYKEDGTTPEVFPDTNRWNNVTQW